MSIAGDLSSMPVEDLLGWVAASCKTGTLVIDGPEFTKRLVVQEGNLIAAASTNPREFLGTYLVGWGLVSAEELDNAVEMQGQHGILAGELLVKIGCITQDHLDEVLLVVAEEAIFDTFLWTSGSFHLKEGVLPSKRFRPLTLPLVPLLIEGARRRDEEHLIRAVVPSLDHRPRIATARDLGGLSQSDLAIVARSDGSRSVEQIAFAAHSRPFVVREVFAAAVRKGLVEMLPPAQDSRHERSSDSYGSVRALVLSCERCIDEGRLKEAWQTIVLLGRRFRAASDIKVLITTLERRIEQALDEQGPAATAVLQIGLLDDAMLESKEGSVERLVVSAVDGRSTVRQLLERLPGEAIANRLILLDLVRRGVLEVTRA